MVVCKCPLDLAGLKLPIFFISS